MKKIQLETSSVDKNKNNQLLCVHTITLEILTYLRTDTTLLSQQRIKALFDSVIQAIKNLAM